MPSAPTNEVNYYPENLSNGTLAATPKNANLIDPCSLHKNPLVRDGLSQSDRFLKALDFDYFKIDERSVEDFINYARAYAEKVKFYNIDNSDGGNWKSFIENDISTTVAIISLFDVNKTKSDFDAQIKSMLGGTDTDEQLKTKLKDCFTFIAGIFKEVDNWYLKSIPDFKLNKDLQAIINGQLNSLLKKLISYDRAAKDNVFIDDNDPFSGYNYLQFSSIWDISDINEINQDYTIYGDADTNAPLDAIRNVSGTLMSLVSVLLSNIQVLRSNADLYLDEMLTVYPEHEPHFALFLTFLQLFKFAQSHLNDLNKKHLEFYYRDVLRLSENEAKPDEVFVIFELAKNFEDHLVEKDSLLRAGKDAIGKNLYYALENDLVVNKATVSDLKTFNFSTEKLKENIYAAPVANSYDGLGLDKDLVSWKPFGNADSPDGELGFAVSSPQLILKEGLRNVKVSFALPDNSLASRNTISGLTVQISGVTGWIDVNAPSVSIEADPLSNNNKLFVVAFSLSQDLPAITGYDAKVHGGTYKTQWPVLKITASGNTGTLSYLNILSKVEITGYDIAVEVGNSTDSHNLQGVNNIIIQNDEGLLSSTKPFKLFTNKPKIGSTFYIGNEEVFQKKITSLELYVEWLGAPKSFKAYYVNYNPKVPDNPDFTAKIQLLDNYVWTDVVKIPQTTPYNPYEIESFSGLLVNHSGGSNGNSGNNEVKIMPYNSKDFSDAKLKYIGNLPSNAGAAAQSAQIAVLESSGLLLNISYINKTELFDATDARFPKLIKLDTANPNIIFTANRDPYQDNSFTQYKAGIKRGFIKLELYPVDFQHSVYPNLYAEAAIKKGTSTTTTNKTGGSSTQPTVANPPVALPNEPYTPVVKQLTLLYKSSIGRTTFIHQSAKLDANGIKQNYKARVEQFFHIFPFGESEFFPVSTVEQGITKRPDIGIEDIVVSSKLFPQFPVAGNDEVLTTQQPPEGNLYIGIKDLKAPETLSLLFQFAQDTGNDDVLLPSVKWSYLSNNRWVAFKDANIVSDATDGFLRSGIIVFDIPVDATNNNTELPSGLHWIKVSTPKFIAATVSPVMPETSIKVFNNILAIKAQAGIARFKDTDNDVDHLRQPLMPLSITKLAEKDFAIKTISQPYSSMNGKVQEQEKDFYIRVSERLKHKNRAITIHDYEHLILEYFPAIYKVRCINVKDYHSELSPGSVTVVLIPNIRQGDRVENNFVLKAGVSLKNDIRKFIAKRISTFVDLAIVDPLYESIQVECKVKFNPGFDSAFYTNKLNEEIKQFLSPWGYDSIESIHFGGKVIGSEVINFIEERPYIDYVTDFALNQTYFNGSVAVWSKKKIMDAVATTAISILVTVDQHSITTI